MLSCTVGMGGSYHTRFLCGLGEVLHVQHQADCICLAISVLCSSAPSSGKQQLPTGKKLPVMEREDRS